jgi:hypothetical protein
MTTNKQSLLYMLLAVESPIEKKYYCHGRGTTIFARGTTISARGITGRLDIYARTVPTS